MSREIELGTKPSFFSRHLHITGIETSSHVTVEDLSDDLAAMDSFELPSLDFRSATKSVERDLNPIARLLITGRQLVDQLFSQHSELLGVAAMLLLFILPLSTFKKESTVLDSIRAKGSDKVVLYRERSGEISQIGTFENSLALTNGDRIRVEVLAATQKHAFYFISNSQQKVLTPVEGMFSERMLLKSGDRAIFPGSIELIGENEGESLHVLLCDEGLGATQLTEITSEYMMKGRTVAKGCLLKTIRLR